MQLKDIRNNYNKDILIEANLPENPYKLFKEWISAAIKGDLYEPTAMILSTLTKNNSPSSRVVLLKDFNENGFVFFSNYESRKNETLSSNNNVALLFFWSELQRQIRIEGKVKKLSYKQNEDYFNSRPIESRVGAIISKQSNTASSRDEIDEAYNAALLNLNNTKIICPKNWGGYIVKAKYFEFWQGRPNRLHDRIIYKKTSKAWTISRLWP